MKIYQISNNQPQNKKLSTQNTHFGAFKTNSPKVITELKKKGLIFYYINKNIITEPQAEMPLKGVVFFTKNNFNRARWSSFQEGKTPSVKIFPNGKGIAIFSWEHYLAQARRSAKFIQEKYLKTLVAKPFEELISYLDHDSFQI